METQEQLIVFLAEEQAGAEQGHTRVGVRVGLGLRLGWCWVWVWTFYRFFLVKASLREAFKTKKR